MNRTLYRTVWRSQEIEFKNMNWDALISDTFNYLCNLNDQRFIEVDREFILKSEAEKYIKEHRICIKRLPNCFFIRWLELHEVVFNEDQKLASLSNNFYLYKGKSIYKLQMIAAKTIPADDKLYSYLENPEINKKNFYSSAKKDSKVKMDEEFKQSDKYVILSVSSSEPSKNDVVICKVKTVDAPSKEENDNSIVVIAILVGLGLFFSLSVGSRSRY